jgi:hypothetical protein
LTFASPVGTPRGDASDRQDRASGPVGSGKRRDLLLEALALRHQMIREFHRITIPV